MDLILASASPRRRDLLTSAGLVFRVVAPGVDESILPGEKPEAHALRVAGAKAGAVWSREQGADGDILALAADTIVVLEERILGKPADQEEARAMLRALNDRSHRVITAVALRGRVDGFAFSRTWAVQTEVTFRKLSHGEIERYLATGEAMDKAGAYGIQGAAAHMVKRIEGSYTNVVGLPLADVLEALPAP